MYHAIFVWASRVEITYIHIVYKDVVHVDTTSSEVTQIFTSKSSVTWFAETFLFCGFFDKQQWT